MQNYAIRVHRTGGPEQLQAEEVPVPEPAEGEVRVRNTCIGLNYLDTYFRSGLYPLPLPFVPGSEGAGVVEAVGPGVTQWREGDRVGYVDPVGAYALRLTRPQDRLVPIPPGISDEIAAAALLKGITAHYLAHSTRPVRAGDTVLVHSAAGGVGQILARWCKHHGATVIGTVGSEAKIAIARATGCDEVLLSGNGGVSRRVRELTRGRGVPVVYDGIGRDTFFDSLDCLAPRGLMVSYGNASGAVESFSLAELAKRGSLFITRPGINAYTQTAAELRERAAAVFDAIGDGMIGIAIHARLPLREVATAHADLQARRTTGSTVLIP